MGSFEPNCKAIEVQGRFESIKNCYNENINI